MKCVVYKDTRGRILERIAMNPTGWESSYNDLNQQAGPGYLTAEAYMSGKFRNKLQRSDLARYARRRGWGEFFCDTIKGREKEEGEAQPAEGACPVIYRTRIGPIKIEVKGWKLRNGFYLPVEDKTRDEGYRFFVTGTLLAEKTVPFDRYDLAEDEFRKFRLPINEISGFYGPDDYHGEKRFAGLFAWRGFDPDFVGGGRFYTVLGWLPSASSDGGVASRPRWQAWMGEPEDVMEVIIDLPKAA